MEVETDIRRSEEEEEEQEAHDTVLDRPRTLIDDAPRLHLNPKSRRSSSKSSSQRILCNTEHRSTSS